MLELPPRSPADTSAPPTIELRNDNGDLVHRVHPERAAKIVSSLLGEWIGSGRRRYVRLAKSVPTLPGGWRGGGNTTQRVRNDQGVIVAPDYIREHKPIQ